jgi:CRISPR/Cas system CSM-associated protein Csm3 (group 7 of RAMP superfamily)
MRKYILSFVLESDATFGRGDGVAGVVDAEVQHDEFGCPYLGGRTLKGLLVNECSEIWAAIPEKAKPRWEKAAQRLFGSPGSGLEVGALMAVGNAQLPEDLRRAIAYDFQRKKLKREDVLESVTALRRQTAIDESGVAKKHSLRTLRVILRNTPFEAELNFAGEPLEEDLALLAACVKAFRRAGTGRNRGRGLLTAVLKDSSGKSITEKYFEIFRKELIQ